MNRILDVGARLRLLPLLCLVAVGACAPAGEDESAAAGQTVSQAENEFKVFFGDLHNHSSLTYGHGSFENALENAAQSLDFFTVTPHAMWPDIDQLQGNPELEVGD